MTIQKPAPDGRDECIFADIFLLLAVIAGQFMNLNAARKTHRKGAKT